MSEVPCQAADVDADVQSRMWLALVTWRRTRRGGADRERLRREYGEPQRKQRMQ